MDIKCWWHDPLAKDIYHTLRQKESLLPQFHAQSPQLTSRRYLVDWLAIICDKYQLCATSRHLAVMLLDFFMDNFDIVDHQLRLVALGCILVATKFEEQEIKIPKANVLNRYVPTPGYILLEYCQMELTLLDYFQWHIGLPTPAHFIDYFLTAAVSYQDLHHNRPMVDIKMAKEYVQKYSSYFLEISLQDHVYREYKPSQVAAASIASSRICLSISPPWGKELQKLSAYTWPTIQKIVNIMMKTHQVDEQAAKNTTRSDSPGGSLPSTPHSPDTSSVPSTPGSVTSTSDNMDTVMLITPTTCAPYAMELNNGSYIIAANTTLQI